jgi:hypothetical protein
MEVRKMKTIIAVLAIWLGIISCTYGRDFKASNENFAYSFSEINGWLGIGQDLETFPQADMVFYAAERNGDKVTIRYPYTELYMYTNLTSGTPEGLWKLLIDTYSKASPKLKVVYAKDIEISGGSKARVIYILNITADNKAQAIASITGKGKFVSLIMQASSEKILRKNLEDFSRMVKTYKDLSVGNSNRRGGFEPLSH